MYDMSQPNEKPGQCRKCRGTGTYSWGAVVNGVARFSGPCHSCGGKGEQTRSDIGRDIAYNRHKVAEIARTMASQRVEALSPDDWRSDVEHERDSY